MGSTKLDCTEIGGEPQGTPLGMQSHLTTLTNNSKTTAENDEFRVDERHIDLY